MSVVGKTFDQLHIYCFCQWDESSPDGDFIDLLEGDGSMDVWILENTETGGLSAYSASARKTFASDQGNRAELLTKCFTGMTKIPSALALSLAQDVDEQSDDWTDEHIRANGGTLEFAEERDNPKDISTSGVACYYRLCTTRVMQICQASAVPCIKINDEDEAQITDASGYLDEEESRVAVYHPQ